MGDILGRGIPIGWSGRSVHGAIYQPIFRVMTLHTLKNPSHDDSLKKIRVTALHHGFPSHQAGPVPLGS
jgi:hypothetical protein